MARGGINKALVIEARQNLIARGENPSIDAVRMELGNTGSKSTIHRYLKEIEAAESSMLSDEALLSEPIRELVGRLASELKKEADELVAKAESNAKLRIEHLESQLKEEKRERESSAKQLAELNNIVQQLYSEKQDLNEKNSQLTLQIKLSTEEQARLNTVIEEKQNLIDSLEEKHTHSREALEHYRESVKEQRDQDIRQHEQRLQSLQIEIRSLTETISVKQTEATQLNRDNARLVAELSALRKKSNQLDSSLLSSNAALEDLQLKNTVIKGSLAELKNEETRLSAELTETRQKLEEATTLNSSLVVKHAKLASEAEVKAEMLERLLENKRSLNSISHD